ncbi:DNA phosphorothioation-associated protein 4 [Microtetraspora malaysiensis]|uniref:DNA phosphorothioation-associated protein 4 n=1 Tax=Microtetraspora malaysiensis TaxID=161358 RepID=UPI003D95097B
MATFNEHRVRPPKDKEALIQQLGADQEGPFQTRYQTLIFAAALGWSRGRRDPLERPGEGIRYDLFRRHTTVEAFIDSLGVLHASNDASIMSDHRLQERISIFEEYANAGLAIIQGELNASRSRPMDVLLDLSRQGDSETSSNEWDDFNSIFRPPDFA